MHIDKAILGVSVIAKAIPIFDEKNNIIGAISFAESTEKLEEMKEMSETLIKSIEITAATAEEISSSDPTASWNFPADRSDYGTGWRTSARY